MQAGRQSFVPKLEKLPEDINNTEPPTQSQQSYSCVLRSSTVQEAVPVPQPGPWTHGLSARIAEISCKIEGGPTFWKA